MTAADIEARAKSVLEKQGCFDNGPTNWISVSDSIAAMLAFREEVRREAFAEAEEAGYRTCAETRHVSLGDKVRTAIAALGEQADG